MKLWTYTTGSGVYSSPAVANVVVYVGSRDNNVYALNAATGSLLWTYTTGSGVYSSPAVVNGVVYVGSADNNTYALNAATGSLLWTYTTGSGVYSSPAVVNGVVYVGSNDNNTYALNAATGSLLWTYTTGSGVYSSPAVSNGVVYVGSRDNNVYALNAATGSLLWTYTTGNEVDSSPAVVNGVVYVGSRDNNVYALNAATGALLWTYTTGDVVWSSPAVANGVVYVGSWDSNVYALNAATGALLWTYTTGGEVDSSPSIANGVVYVGSWDSNVYALNAATGALLWTYTTGDVVRSSPAVSNGVVYVGSYDGNVYAIGSLPSVLPTITTIFPDSKQVGSGGFMLTVTGTNYNSGSRVRWNGANRTTSYASSTQLIAYITASDMASVGSATVTVYNANSGLTSNSKMFTIPPQSTPTITNISPDSKQAGSEAFTLTVLGTNYYSGSKVRWNGADRTTTYISLTQLNASISASDIATTGSATVTVYNADSDQISNIKTFTITSSGSTPQIDTITPTNTTAGGPAFTLVVAGSGFIASSVVMWNGVEKLTNYTPETLLLAQIPISDVANAGTASVTVHNPGGGTSNPVTFTINPQTNPVPAVTSIIPVNASAGGSAFTLTVAGSNFVSSSKVRWNGADRTTTYLSATQLTAQVSAADIASAGTATVTVFNPLPGGGTSNGVTFTIKPQQNPVPSVTSISPVNATAGGSAFTLAVTGSNFITSSKVSWNGADRTTTFVSATQLTAQVSAADIASAGTATVTVFNPLPGGGTSSGITFEIKSGPTISTITPSTRQAGSPAFTLIVNGTHFNSGSKVRWNGVDRTTKYLSTTQVNAAIPSSDIAMAGSATVTVYNPDSGLTSNSKTFTITSTGVRSILLVKSYPTNAIVYIDGEIIGKSGIYEDQYSVSEGVHTLKLTKTGYEDWEGTVTIKWPLITVRNVKLIKVKST
jgi:hypothetical protein